MFFPKIYRYRLFGISMDLRYVMFLNAYIKAISLFPDITPKENRELSKLVIFDILGRSHDLKNKEEKKEAAEQLRESLFSDEEIIDTVANYFLIEHFRFLTQYEDGHDKIYKEKADEALSKAKSYKNTAEPVSAKDINNIKKEIKKEIKILKKSIKKINSNKIEKEKEKRIKPIKITPSIVFLFISLISSLFLVGGFLYTNTLLYFLDINSSDFFDTSDYIASSVDTIFPILLIVFCMMFFCSQKVLDIKGELDGLSEAIAAEQLDDKQKFMRFVLIALFLFFVTSFYVELTYNEKFTPMLLMLPALMVLGYILFDLLKIDKYIENGSTFIIVVFSFFIFLAYLSVDVSGTVYEIKSENYKSPYTVFFTEEYEEYSDHTFFLANSKYAFFLNKKTKETVVIPKTGIKAIQTKKRTMKQ